MNNPFGLIHPHFCVSGFYFSPNVGDGVGIWKHQKAFLQLLTLQFTLTQFTMCRPHEGGGTVLTSSMDKSLHSEKRRRAYLCVCENLPFIDADVQFQNHLI